MKSLVRVCVALIAIVMVAALAGPAVGVLAQDGGPEPCVNTYIVKDGDTLYSISRQFDVNLNELAEANDVENVRLIFIGEALCLDGLAVAQPDETTSEPQTNGEGDSEFGTGGPDDSAAAPAEPTPDFPVLAEADIMIRDVAYTTDTNGVYIVREDDRLYNLSFIFGVAQSELAAVNNLGNPAIIIPGQTLFIPRPTFSTAVPGNLPAIAMTPRVARPGESVMVYGANYPANTDINIYAEKFSLNRISEVIDTVTTDENGRFEVEVEIPTTFNDGGALDMRTVSISGRVDGQPDTFGAHFFLNLDWLDANNR